MSTPVPVSMPEDLLAEVAEAAADTGLSQQDIIRQSTKLGLPQLLERLAARRSLKPFSAEEARLAFAPDPEWEKVEAAMSRRPKPRPEVD